MHVALATREQVGAMLAISNWAAAHTVANFATEPEPLATWQAAFDETELTHPWLVALADGEVMGFALAAPHHARGAYAWTVDLSVYVAAAHQRRGVGRALYSALIPTLRAQGYATALAGITLPNPASVALHEGFGFVRCGTFHRAGYKELRWHDVGYWELALHAGEGAPASVLPVRDVWRTDR